MINTNSKFDKFKRNFLIVSCVILGSFFLAACTYMITLISDVQKTNKSNNNPQVQNINLVNM